MPTADKRPLLILDLDETLVHAASEAKGVAHDFEVGPYFVFMRPHLSDFLQTVVGVFRLAVWSSSSADYVAAITEKIFSENLPLEFAWSRTRCTQRYHPEWQSQYWVKDLKKVRRLGYHLDRTLIVDDTPRKLERNYGNAVYVSSFEGDPGDRELLLLAPYLVSLARYDDLRAIEKRGWRASQLQSDQE